MKRNYGIDLLRFVFMFMICLWHILGQGGVIRSSALISNYQVVYGALVVICYCAVDGFALISGYTANNQPKKYEKLVSIWFQVFFYSFVLTIILSLLGFYHSNISLLKLLTYAFPITNVIFWYMTAYFILFLFRPMIDSYLFGLSEDSAKKAFIILIVLFSIIGFLTDPFVTANGYSALWIMVLYAIGLLAKRIHLFEEKSSFLLVLIWIILQMIPWGVNVCLGNALFINYLSPTVLFSALILVVLFSRVKLKGTVLSKITPYVLGVYLFQLCPVVWESIHNAFSLVVLRPIGNGILYVLLYSASLFVVGMMVDFIRSCIFKWISMDEISKKIVTIFQQIFLKLSNCFK